MDGLHGWPAWMACMDGLHGWMVSRSVDGVCRAVSSAAMGCSSNVTHGSAGARWIFPQDLI
jgi:hypothetical protein